MEGWQGVTWYVKLHMILPISYVLLNHLMQEKVRETSTTGIEVLLEWESDLSPFTQK